MAPHLLDKIGDYLHHYNLEDRRPFHAEKDQMKKTESYLKKIKPYLKMKNISKKNRRTMIKDDEGLLRGITNHVYVLPTKEKPTEEPEVFLANASEVYRRRTSLDYENFDQFASARRLPHL